MKQTVGEHLQEIAALSAEWIYNKQLIEQYKIEYYTYDLNHGDEKTFHDLTVKMYLIRDLQYCAEENLQQYLFAQWKKLAQPPHTLDVFKTWITVSGIRNLADFYDRCSLSELGTLGL